MTRRLILSFTAIVIVCMVSIQSGVTAMCEITSPITETAYDGAYEIRFPESVYSPPDPAICRWLISAYRKEYVVRLEFDDVFLERSSQKDACMEEISVYDGSRTTDTLIASFCGRDEPRLKTSSRDTLVVFSSNKSAVVNSTFKLKYKAVKDHQHDEDTGQILRTSFGVFIGAIAFGVIFSWVFRKYKQARRIRGVSVFGYPRVNTSSNSGGQNLYGRQRHGRRGIDHREDSQIGRPGRLSFKNKVTVLFQDIVMKLSLRRTTTGSLTTGPADNVGHPQHIHQPLENYRPNCCLGRAACLRNAASSDDTHNTAHIAYPATNLENIRTGQAIFSYPIIALSSFTSDPNAVRPPTYEDCINNVNPVYLPHHHGNTFYNRAFSLKDEELDCVQILSPPPPYSEIGPEISSLGALSEEARCPERVLSCQQPPQYELLPIGTTSIMVPVLDITVQSSVTLEQNCGNHNPRLIL